VAVRFALLGAVVLVAMAAGAARPCDDAGLVGLRFVPFPAPVPTWYGNMATGAYVDDRAQGDVAVPGVGIPTGVPAPAGGRVWGDGTWLYLETNGQPGLQRGGASDVLNSLPPCAPLNTECDPEWAQCAGPDPDELVL
jgi:hypothetical protein